MRKQLALAGVCVVGLVAPTTVGAATKSYNGTFEPGGTLSFKVKNTNNGKKVKAFTFVGFPVQCNSGPETTSGNLSFAPKVKDKKFEADAILGNPSNPQARLTLVWEAQGRRRGRGHDEGERFESSDRPERLRELLQPEDRLDRLRRQPTSEQHLGVADLRRLRRDALRQHQEARQLRIEDRLAVR